MPATTVSDGTSSRTTVPATTTVFSPHAHAGQNGRPAPLCRIERVIDADDGGVRTGQHPLLQGNAAKVGEHRPRC